MTETRIKLNSMNEVKEFVRFANMHKGDITLFSGKYIVDAKSIMGVFSLDLSNPIKVEINGTMPLDVKNGIGQFVVNEN